MKAVGSCGKRATARVKYCEAPEEPRIDGCQSYKYSTVG
jgi:hypothetical protein